MSKKTQTIGEVTNAQITQWKQAHGNVYRFDVETEDAVHVCYLKEPEIDKLGAITSKAKTDEMAAGLLFLKACWLGGDEKFKSNVKLMAGVSSQMHVLTESKSAKVKKL
ncbi:MAG: hypothetical protein N4A35_05425 [Flavobacteriales bacterium]|jgi:hypothetical protein|nr:hypothetical protein [Flavobacteriales bacterium]